jgi:hypothetical protein
MGAFVSTDLNVPPSYDEDYASSNDNCGDYHSFLCSFDQNVLLSGVDGSSNYVTLARDYSEGGYLQFGIDGAFYLSFCDSYVNSTYKTSQFVSQQSPDATLPESFVPVKTEAWIIGSQKKTGSILVNTNRSQNVQSTSVLRYHTTLPLFEVPVTTTIRSLSCQYVANSPFMLVDDAGQFHALPLSQTLEEVCASSVVTSSRLLHFSTDDRLVAPSESTLLDVDSAATVLPALRVFAAFANMGGTTLLLSLAKRHVEQAFGQSDRDKFGRWLEMMDKWTLVSQFTDYFMNSNECRSLLLFCLGIKDDDSAPSDSCLQDPFKCLLTSAKQLLLRSPSPEIRQQIFDHDLLEFVMSQLKRVSNLNGRHRVKSEPLARAIQEEQDDSEHSSSESDSDDGELPTTRKLRRHGSKTKLSSTASPKKKGIGYGSDDMDSSLASKWDPSLYLKKEEERSAALQEYLDFISVYLHVEVPDVNNHWVPCEGLGEYLAESPLLPVIEQAFENDSLLEMGKIAKLYHAALGVVDGIASHESLLWLLDDLGDSWAPVQRHSISSQLQKLKQLSSIFLKCLNPNAEAEFAANSLDRNHEGTRKVQPS